MAHTPSQFCVLGHKLGSLKSAVMGIFIPRKSVKATNRAFFSTESSLLNAYRHVTAQTGLCVLLKQNCLDSEHIWPLKFESQQTFFSVALS